MRLSVFIRRYTRSLNLPFLFTLRPLAGVMTGHLPRRLKAQIHLRTRGRMSLFDVCLVSKIRSLEARLQKTKKKTICDQLDESLQYPSPIRPAWSTCECV